MESSEVATIIKLEGLAVAHCAMGIWKLQCGKIESPKKESQKIE